MATQDSSFDSTKVVVIALFKYKKMFEEVQAPMYSNDFRF